VNWLATAAGADALVSGDWVLKLIGAIFTGAALVLGRYWGRKESETTREVTLKKPVPTVRTQEEPRYVQREEFREHCDAASAEMRRIWEHFGVERKLANDELSKIHERLNFQSQATSELKGSLDQVQANVKSLLDLALGKIPRQRP
jgi:hypothetical protein